MKIKNRSLIGSAALTAISALLLLVVLSGCAEAPLSPVTNINPKKSMSDFPADHAKCDKLARKDDRDLWLMGVEFEERTRMKRQSYEYCMQEEGYRGGNIKKELVFPDRDFD